MTPKETIRNLVFPPAFGVFLALAFLKFGNPAIMEGLVARPTNLWEWAINSWPASVGLMLLLPLTVVGICSWRWRSNAPTWLLLLPLVWLGWQLVSATQTVDKELSSTTVQHFAACVSCFYLGYFALSKSHSARLFFYCLLTGFLIVIAIGWQQRWGGLEETRQYFFTYLYPQMTQVSPEYLKKLSSKRIFSTLFYPNALAGFLLLLLPLSLATVWQLGRRLTNMTRWVLVGLIGVTSLACLAWSGSKAGWLLMLLLGVITLLRQDLKKKCKGALIILLLIGGLAGFGIRYAGYFKKGAGSAAARLDYWHAATKTALTHPIVGTGPGTFAIPYEQIKKPESEMTRLVHNDYLEQASDSGFAGLLSYTAFIAMTLWASFKKIWPKGRDNGFKFAVLLGLMGWALQGCTEFGLYIPALSWVAFALLGWILASGNGFDSESETH